MSWAPFVIIALFAIGYVVVAVIRGAFRIISGIEKTAGALGNGLVNWLGRKGLNRKALIAPELELKNEPTKPAHRKYNLGDHWSPGLESKNKTTKPNDPERHALTNYMPHVAAMQVPSTVRYERVTDVLVGQFAEPSKSIDIDEVPEILKMSSHLPYEPLFATFPRTSKYPVMPLKAPSAPDPPPSWTPWQHLIPEPKFDPPYYTGHLSILNRFVDGAYRDEFARVSKASYQKREIEETATLRDREVEALFKQAKEKWDALRTEQQQGFVAITKKHAEHAQAFASAANVENAEVQNWSKRCQVQGAEGLLSRIELAMRTMKLPDTVSRESQSRFDADSGILIHEHRFPDLADLEWFKFVQLKGGLTPKPASQKEKQQAGAKLWSSLCLRLACEIARLDTSGIVKAVVTNGWADYTAKATGQRKRAYCASLFATKEQVTALNLAAVDPNAAFNSLKGIAAHSLELTPIAPIMRLDTNDSRFVDAKVVLARMTEGANLAAMDWEDFEHLCRELFERAFASSGAEVKVTQVSRDQGVDAVIFDPDPLRGGKIVVQAKRYTNPVDVSAVRDLYGAVINEGAIKGILVTTSYYGPDSYSFAKDKPITLLNGRELLGLLEQFGYAFRIDLAEAKKMMSSE